MTLIIITALYLVGITFLLINEFWLLDRSRHPWGLIDTLCILLWPVAFMTIFVLSVYVECSGWIKKDQN